MYKQIDSNKRKTWLVMAMFFVIIAVIAGLVYAYTEDLGIVIVLLGVSAVYALIQYFAASTMALKMSGAREITKSENPRFYNIVENLAITAGLPMPKVYIMDEASPNAFATGRDPEHASVAATSGLINMMSDRELTGVMAHELAHVGNYDIRVSLVAFALTVAISVLADVILRIGFRSSGSSDRDNKNGGGVITMVLLMIAVVLAPLVASLIQLAVSRKREYLADATAVLTTRDAEGLASALDKLRNDTTPMHNANPSMANMYIKNPLRKGLMSNLLSTHPPLEERISALRGMTDNF